MGFDAGATKEFARILERAKECTCCCAGAVVRLRMCDERSPCVVTKATFSVEVFNQGFSGASVGAAQTMTFAWS